MPQALTALLLSAGVARAEATPCPVDTGNPREMEAKGRAMFEEALRREPADPRGALEILSCAQRIADKPAVSLRVGLIAERLGNKRLAAESYERYLALAGDAAPDRVELTRHIQKLRAELAKKPVEPSPDPDPEPPPTPPKPEPAASPTLGWVTLAVGGALMIGGGYFLWSAKSRNDHVHELEPGSTYWNSPEAQGEMDAAKREQTLGVVGLAAGAVVTGLGAWLVLDQKRGVSATATVGPRSSAAAVRVRF
ncbi:MAG: hypothetical protein IT377_34650 [Polyangiaceae bacterium]|nr:hypothetical protein [Myxococcales bacterium]MCC6904160.1 hypothetical protein [Polyangiaceae bacterium]